MLTAISLLTMSAISVGRLLALLLSVKYRHIVTLTRFPALIIFFWIASIAFPSLSFWKYMILKSFKCTLLSLCILISAFIFSKVFRLLRYQQTQLLGQIQQKRTNGEGISMNVARYSGDGIVLAL